MGVSGTGSVSNIFECSLLFSRICFARRLLCWVVVRILSRKKEVLRLACHAQPSVRRDGCLCKRPGGARPLADKKIPHTIAACQFSPHQSMILGSSVLVTITSVSSAFQATVPLSRGTRVIAQSPPAPWSEELPKMIPSSMTNTSSA